MYVQFKKNNNNVNVNNNNANVNNNKKSPLYQYLGQNQHYDKVERKFAENKGNVRSIFFGSVAAGTS